MDDAFDVIRAFNDRGVEYVLIGGVAVNLHGLLRGTEDVDFLIRPDPDNVARVRAALMSLFDDESVEEITAGDMERYAVIRYGPPTGAFYVDLISKIGDAFRFDDIESEVLEVEGLGVRVATAKALYRMKRDTVREKDRHDALALQVRYGLGDEGE